MQTLRFGQFSALFSYIYLTCSLCRWDGGCVITIYSLHKKAMLPKRHTSVHNGRIWMILLTWRQGVAQDRFSRRRCICGFIRNREIYWAVGRPSASRGTLPLTSLYNWRYSNKNYIEPVLQTDRKLSDAGICKPWVSNPWPIRSYCAARGQICKWCIHLSCCLAYNMPVTSSKASSPQSAI